MFAPSDIPAFRELIFANAAILFKDEPQLDIVVYSQEDSKSYIASLVVVATTDVLISGAVDANIAVAVHNLFDETAGRVAKLMEQKYPSDKKGGAAKGTHADKVS